MSILSISGLTHVWDDKVLFKEAEMDVNNGEHIGIVGLNGAGKTTFMNIISGKLIQDEGSVKWLNGIKWGYLDQHADIDRSLTVLKYLEGSFSYLFDMNEAMEKMYEKMSTETDADALDKLINKSASLLDQLTINNFFDLESSIKKVANGLGVNNFGYDTMVATLSGGQRAKLMLAKLLLEDLDVLLLDEPTNFLDLEHIEWLKKYLISFEKTFMLISHDESFLNDVCKIIVNIENKSIKKYHGDYKQFMEQRENNAQQYADAYERQKRDIKKMEDYIAKNKARASTAGMANSRKKMLDRIEVLDKPHVLPKPTFVFPYTPINTKDLLVVEELSIGYNRKAILPPISMHMRSETKLWIRGTNGLGKSTLLKTLMKQLSPIGGDFNFHFNVKVNYLEQDLSFNASTSNAISFMNECFPRMASKEIRTQLARVGIINDMALKSISLLSGGEQVRIKLCVLMQSSCNLLILDEPTNHLDVHAKESLSQALKQFPGSIVLVSHESAFASEICNEIFDVVF